MVTSSVRFTVAALISAPVPLTAFPCVKALTVYPVKVDGEQVFAALDAGTCVDTPV